MFLLSSTDFASAESLRRSGEDRSKGLKEKPEPDSLRLMDGILEQFLPRSGFMGYDLVLSQVPVEQGYSTLRAIGGATFRAREEHQVSNVPLGKQALLDGLAQNLLQRALSTASNFPVAGSLTPARLTILGSRKSKEKLSLKYFFAELNTLSNWRDRPISYLDRTALKDWKCGVLIGHSWLNLLVRAEVNGSGVPFRIYSMELLRSSEINERTQIEIGNAIIDAVEDQKRRIGLAERYEKAPLAPALPAELRAKLKSVLEDMGIPNGSYSREGFSSGRFPYDRTVSPITGRHPSNSLVFERCSCGAVKAVKLQNCNEEQKRFFRNFSKGQLRNWHRSICSQLREAELDELRDPFESSWSEF